MTKPKIALYWCSSCGGCEESVLDMAEQLLTLQDMADIVFWPVAMDYKYDDLESMKDGEISATLINGAIRMEEQVSMAKLLRKKSAHIIAHGSCAHLGGVVGLANWFTSEDILKRSYEEVPTITNPQRDRPGKTGCKTDTALKLSPFLEYVTPLDRVVDVDLYIPGCPPTPTLVKEAIMTVLNGSWPDRGTILGDKRALCHTCPRKDTRIDDLKIKRFNRLHETEWDPKECFLNQHIICLGPATRGGCEARCINGNMPCRACFGPTDNVKDCGAKAISFFSSIIDSRDETELMTILKSIPDPAGLVYRYSTAASMLERKR